MKPIFLLFYLTLSLSTTAFAQVSVVVDSFCNNLTKNDLNFSGSRVLHCVGVNDKNSENYIVVSKNGQGEKNDELYIEKFTKKSDNKFKITFS